MSLRALTWAVENQDCRSSSAKLVLIAYANYANEHHLAYPSNATVCRITGLDPRTVRACIGWLDQDALLEDTGKYAGRSQQVKVYRLAVEPLTKSSGVDATPADDGAPDQSERRQPPARPRPTKLSGVRSRPTTGINAFKDRQNCQSNLVTEPSPPDEAEASSPPRGGKRDRGKPIPSGWRPTSIAGLPPRASALVRSWPPGAYDAEAEAFANWARGADHRRADWAAAWCSWIVRVTAKVLRDGKVGVRHAASSAPDTRSSGELAQAALDRASLYAKMGRDDDAAQARAQAEHYRKLAGADSG